MNKAIKATESESLSLVSSVSDSDVEERRASIELLEECMLKESQVEIPVTHRFNGGMYSRQIKIPAGTMLVGRVHKFDHFDVMLSGDITVSTDTGETKRLTGYNVFEGKAGKKRAGYAHEDTHWITFHSAEIRNEDEMYDYLTCKNHAEYEQFKLELDRADYALMVDEIGMTEPEIRAQAESDNDRTVLDEKYTYLYVAPSKIEGDGFFTDLRISSGMTICEMRVNGLRTEAGRYVNHSFNPNSVIKMLDDGNIELLAIRDIEGGEELTVSYRNVLQHRMQREDLL